MSEKFTLERFAMNLLQVIVVLVSCLEGPYYFIAVNGKNAFWSHGIFNAVPKVATVKN